MAVNRGGRQATALAGGIAATGLYGLAVGIPTDMVPNPWFTRMLAPTAWSYLFWILPAILVGLLAATYVWPRAAVCPVGPRVGAGGVLSYLAVGCPICNKLVVGLLGTSGAISYFRPAQPLIGVGATLLLAYAVWLRTAGRRPAPAC